MRDKYARVHLRMCMSARVLHVFDGMRWGLFVYPYSGSFGSGGGSITVETQ
jgi:hypothetical protein